MNERKLVVLAFCSSLCVQFAAHAQQIPADLERIEVPLPLWIATRPRSAPATIEDLTHPATIERDFREALNAIVNRDWSRAKAAASAAKYELVAAVEGDRWFAVLQERGGLGLGPTVIVAPEPLRDIIAEAPHAAFERGTEEQAGLIVTILGARAAIVAGAHRCAAQRTSLCSGTTQVCDPLMPPAPYRTSDVGHNPATLFHVAHQFLSEAWRSAVVISLHGMRKRDQTLMILSDGSRQKRQPDGALPGKLKREMRGFVDGKNGEFVSCNDTEDDALPFIRLCGYTNVQGRHMNASSDICRQSVDTPTGRFLHIEQTWDILEQFQDGWNRWKGFRYAAGFLNALAAVVPCLKANCNP